MNKFDIGKRATFERNIKLITGRKNLSMALDGWTVVRVIDLTDSQPMATCELCGTRFKRGALMRHHSQGTTVTIGGICAEVIRTETFGSPAKYHIRQAASWKIFQEHYGDLISRGTWLTWLVRNAPPRLSRKVAELQFFNAVRSDNDMRLLIRYHDAHRRYPVAALIPQISILKRSGIAGLPKYLTLDEARRLIKALRGNTVLIKRKSERFLKGHVFPFLAATEYCRHAWRTLSPNDRRCVNALAALSEEGRSHEASSLYEQFDGVDLYSSAAQFVWNPLKGLAFVPHLDKIGNDKIYAHLILWGHNCETDHFFDMHYFKTIKTEKLSTIKFLEKLAFGFLVKDYL
jgi:hypothetical protein